MTWRGWHCQGKGPTSYRRSKLRRKELLAEIAAIEGPAREAVVANRRTRPVELRPLAAWDFRQDRQEQTAGWEIKLRGAARLTPAGLELPDDTSFAMTGPQAQPLRAKTLEVWVRLANVSQAGGAAIGVQTPDGGVFDAIVFGERDPRQWMAGSDNYVRTQSFSVARGNRNRRCAGAIVSELRRGWHDRGLSKRHAVRRALSHRWAGGICRRKSASRLWRAAHSRRAGQDVGRHDRACPTLRSRTIGRRDHDRLGPGRDRDHDSRAAQRRAANAFDRLQAEVARLTEKIAVLQPPQVYAIKPRQPEPTHLLGAAIRHNRRRLLRRAGSARWRLAADFALPADAAEGRRRQKFAQWITDPRNPIFARVMANRLWHYHFGVGLVDTPNDFGFNGGRPANQKLLDWLAAEFIAGGYRLKTLHRLIVTSETYRQASRLNEAAAKIDADNRLLWRRLAAASRGRGGSRQHALRGRRARLIARRAGLSRDEAQHRVRDTSDSVRSG